MDNVVNVDEVEEEVMVKGPITVPAPVAGSTLMKLSAPSSKAKMSPAGLTAIARTDTAFVIAPISEATAVERSIVYNSEPVLDRSVEARYMVPPAWSNPMPMMV